MYRKGGGEQCGGFKKRRPHNRWHHRKYQGVT